MLTLNQYLEEATNKNVHLEHLEDLVLEGGVTGTRNAINFLISLKDMLAGHSSRSYINLTTKWDGAPAVFAGINPDNGKFFVATKGIFNKNPKLNYTPQDIDQNHSGGLANKLKVALQYLPELGIKSIYQGDLMFTKQDLKSEKLNGETYITFQPNTIVYAVPKNSYLGRTISASKMGIVWHTQYRGSSMNTLKASFGVNANNFSPSRNVWSRDASFVDLSGTATFTSEETKKVTELLTSMGNLFRSISPKVLNNISSNDQYKILLKTFHNTKVREGEKISDPGRYAYEFIRWLSERLTNHSSSAQRLETKDKREKEKAILLRFFRSNAGEMKKIFQLQNMIIDAKLIITRKLSRAEQAAHTFIRDGDGLKVTNHEGFVAVDHIGNAVKLVDRLSFSHHNFNVQKNWG